MRKGYTAGTVMEGGYPSEADMLDFFHARGLELLTENNPIFIPEFLQFLWGLLSCFDWAGVLGVYCPSTTKSNVRAGKYLFAGVLKTYTPGADIDPTNNDTTYIWLKSDNTVGYGIDGNGWPSDDHIKLAEIDVDVDGVITDVRDLRSQAFLGFKTYLELVPRVICKDNQVVCKDNEVVIK